MLLSTTALLLQLLAAPAPQDPRMLRDARAAQVRFEGLRRMHLPRDRSGSPGSACDARIGRFCYWYDSTEAPVVPEPRRISEARSSLLAFLDSASARNPSDGWLAGQRIRYLIEAGRSDAAVVAARACQAERWWCAALEGLSLHVSERYVAADSAFAAALREMPEAQRCAWLDLSGVAPERLTRELSRATCDERSRLADRLWMLGQPLWSTPGNDLRTEHFARLTMATILPRSATAHGMSWGDDSRELLLRYGWAEWFTRQDPDLGLSTLSPRITGHDREPSYSLFPEVQSVASPARLDASSWRLRAPVARSRYAPRHIKRLSALSHQLVRFPRGDSTLLAVAYAVTDTALTHDSISGAIGLYGESGLRVHRSAGGPHGLLSALVPSDTLVMSVEVLGTRSKRAARARYTIEPLACGGAWCLSDLLLFDPSRGYVGTDVDLVLPEALTEARVSTRGTLGVLWEIQGMPSMEPIWLSLTVEPLPVGLARRIANRLHLAPKADRVRLRWQSSQPRSSRVENVTLRLPTKARGKYRVVLTVEPPNGPALSASRDIELVP